MRWFRIAAAALYRALLLLAPVPRVPKVVKCIIHDFTRKAHAKVIGGGAAPAFAALAAFLFFGAMLAVVSGLAGGGGDFLLAAPALLTLKRAEYQRIADSAKAIQDKHPDGKRWPKDDGEAFEALCKEAEAIAREIESIERFDALDAKMVASGRKVEAPTPADGGTPDAGDDDPVVGYVTLGDAIIRSPEFQKFAAANYPKASVPVLSVPVLRGNLVPLTKRALADFRKAGIQMKAVPTLGAGVLDPARVEGIPQVTADTPLVLRSVLNVSRTSQSAVEWVREDAYTRAAAPTAHGQSKPEGALEYSLQSSTVRTLAVWIPATVQMLSDWAALRNLIDGRLLYDLAKEEEEQVMYGDGTGQNFAGIVPNAGIDIASNGRYSALTHTLIDVIRMGITDTKRAGYAPNAVILDPLDWEGVVIMKGTDDHYLAQVFPNADGSLRVWGLTAVETVACEDAATGERNVVVGDFRRGATLWVREDASVVIGMQNDDLTKNLRTILAEERAAFAVQAPDAFAYFQTQAPTT